MADINTSQYQQNSLRYRHYYQNLARFYRKPVTQVSTALLLTVFTVTFFLFFAILPTLETISELIRKIQDQEQVLVDLNKKSTALSAVQNEYALVSPELPRIYQAVPENRQVDELLLMIESIAAQNNLPINSLQVGEYTIGGKSKETSDEYDVTINISLKAPYIILNQFLKDLETIPRIVVIDSLRFSPDETETRTTSINNLNLALTLRAFYQPKK